MPDITTLEINRNQSPISARVLDEDLTLDAWQPATNDSISTAATSLKDNFIYTFQNRQTNYFLCLANSTPAKEQHVIQWKGLKKSAEMQHWIYRSHSSDKGILFPLLSPNTLCLDRYEWKGKPLHNYADLWPRDAQNQNENQTFIFEKAIHIRE